MTRRVAFLGGGKMGEALVSGLIRSGGRNPDEIMVTARREERVRELAERNGVVATLSNPEAVEWAETVVLTVKPQDIEALLGQVAGHVTPEHLVVSFAAGVRTSFVEKHLVSNVPVVRVMSNVAVLVDEAMSVVSPGSQAEDKHLSVADELLPHGQAPRGAPGDGDLARRDDHRGYPPPGGGGREGRIPERHRCRLPPERRAGPGRRRGRGRLNVGRGARARVRWAHDRERRKKAREKRKAAELAATKKKRK